MERVYSYNPEPTRGTCYIRAHSRRNKSQIVHGDQIRCDENLYTVHQESDLY